MFEFKVASILLRGFNHFMTDQLSDLNVLAFDVFGTVVDWHGSVAREVEQLNIDVNGDAFALAWRAGYKPAMERVMSGNSGWIELDSLHRTILDEILLQFNITSLTEREKQTLNKVWHRLDPWPDSVAGLTRLKSRYIITSLSNGNLGLLTKMAKNAGLPWDCVLSAEVFRKYKPHPDVYSGVASIFDIKPEQVMMVAAHHDDLAAARSCGLKTAYIERPFEYGRNNVKDVSPNPENTLHAQSLSELATLLGCDETS